jgi:ribosomal protein S18 acetylase RimI-like enzyme
MGDVKIRKAVLADLRAVQDLNYALFLSERQHHDSLLDTGWCYGAEGEAYFRDTITKENQCCFVAEVDKKVVGYLAGSIKPTDNYRLVNKEAELDNTCVLEDYRSQGIGRQLTEKFLEWCDENSAEKIIAIAYALNKKAIKFYQEMGFTPRDIVLERSCNENKPK